MQPRLIQTRRWFRRWATVQAVAAIELVSTRTIRRDIRTLRKLGFQISRRNVGRLVQFKIVQVPKRLL